LIAAGDLTTFQVPIWVVVLSAVTIAFGTYAGGWRIIRTLGWSINQARACKPAWPPSSRVRA